MYGIDINYIIIGLAAAIAVLLLLIIVLFVKLSSLKKKYLSFMKGANGESLEEQVKQNYELMQSIGLRQEEQQLDIQDISNQTGSALSRVNIVKYNAFRDMSSKLSFALTVLNDQKDGYIINCMHSTNGSYVYAKSVKDGRCDMELSKEEEQSLDGAINGTM